MSCRVPLLWPAVGPSLGGVRRCGLACAAPDSYGVAMTISAPSGAFVVAHTGYGTTMLMRGTKTVSFGDLDLFSVPREVLHYEHNQKIEICSCLSVALAVRKQTHDVCVWISDCRAESRLLRVRLELKWSFLRVLLIAVQKPVMGSLFSLLPMCSHNSRSVCPILLHIVKLLQGVCVFG